MTGPTRLILLAILLALALVAFPHTTRNFESSNELSSLYLSTAIIAHRSLSINQIIQQWGDIIDKSRRSEKFYSDKAPGAALLAIIPATILKGFSDIAATSFTRDQALIFARMIAVIFPCLLFLLFIPEALRPFSKGSDMTIALTLAYSLGTPAWVYSTLLYGHQLSAAALFVSYALLRQDGAGACPKGEHASPLHHLGTGCLLGLAVALDYSAGWGAACILVYAIRGGALKKGWFWCGLFLPVALLCAYHWAAFGGPLKTGYSFKVYSRDAAVHAQGILGIGLPSLSVLKGILFSLKRGLFFYCPWLLFAIPGFVRMARRGDIRSDFVLCLCVVLGHTLLIGSFRDWTAGWSYGPRHLVPMLPFLLPPLVIEMEAAGRVERLCLAALIGISIVTTALAVATFPHVPVELDNPLTDLFLPLLKAGDVGPLIGPVGHVAALVPIILIVTASVVWVSVGMGKRYGIGWVTGFAAAALIAAGAWIYGAENMPRQEGPEKNFAMSQVYSAVGDYKNATEELIALTTPSQTLDLRLYATFTLWKMAENQNNPESALIWRRQYLDLLNQRSLRLPMRR